MDHADGPAALAARYAGAMTWYALAAAGILVIVLLVLLASRVVRGAFLVAGKGRGKGPGGAGLGGFVGAIVSWFVLWLVAGAVLLGGGLMKSFFNMWQRPPQRDEGLLDVLAVVWVAALPAGLLGIVGARAAIRRLRRRASRRASGSSTAIGGGSRDS